MRPIPKALREKLSTEPRMECCCYPNCSAPPEWEHVFIVGGRQINTEWSIIPVCYYHHRGGGIDKNYHRWYSLNLAIMLGIDPSHEFERTDWAHEYQKVSEYGTYNTFLALYNSKLER